MRIGIDVGGTNTDAVLMDGDRVVAATKSATTADVGGGIAAAAGAVLAQSRMAAGALDAVMIGTTHFTNAFVERRRLNRVAVIRLGYPATTAIPPLYGWPEDLLAHVAGDRFILPGGSEFDGRPISRFDEMKVAEAARAFTASGTRAIAVSSVFAPMNAEQEERAAAIVRDIVPDAEVSLSSSFGRLGLIERENAAVMNASLLDIAGHTVRAFGEALARLGITAPLFISQNDGTLMSAAQAMRFPVLTFASGPTNSMRGAALLSGRSDALVIDIGGTTTDVGALQGGFPRESALTSDIGGVRTNFRMPDLVSAALGGGSILTRDGDDLRVGPHSVGYALVERALVFGGDVLTTTDIAVAAGLADIGDRSRVRSLDAKLVDRALSVMRSVIENTCDRMKLNSGSAPAILVGGGSILVADGLAGISEIITPPHHAVANAVGAAIAQAGGAVDRYYAYEQTGRDAALADAREQAADNAVANGADPRTVDIVEIEELPLAYLGGGATRVRVRAVGTMRLSGSLAADSVAEGTPAQ